MFENTTTYNIMWVNLPLFQEIDFLEFSECGTDTQVLRIMRHSDTVILDWLHTISHSLTIEVRKVIYLYYSILEHAIFCRLALDIDPAMTSQEHVNPQLALQRHVQTILDLMDH